MTDYRDPNRPGYRDPDLPADAQSWSNATWGWIAALSVVMLVLIFAFGSSRDRTATDTSNPPTTTGQRVQRPLPIPPTSGPTTDAPTMNRPAPELAPAPAPAPAPALDAR